MLVDACAADGAVDDADGNLLALPPGAWPVPCPSSRSAASRHRGCEDGFAPQPDAVWVSGHAAVAADPLAVERGFLFAPIRRHGVGLAVDDVGVAADQVGRGMQNRLFAAAGRSELDPVLDESRLELHGEGVGLVRAGLGRLRLDELVVGIELQKDSVGGSVQRAVVVQRAFVLVVAGIELVVLRLLILGGRPRHPGIAASAR